jgi:GT2 family glycosyltransferase
LAVASKERLALVAVAIPSWNGMEHLTLCLEALQGQPVGEILVHTNGSVDGTDEFLRAHYPRVKLIRSQRNVGFARAVNEMVEAAECEWVALLNNDTRPQSSWVEDFDRAASRAPDDVAVLAGLLTDWEEERLDFAMGAMTFCGHAFGVDSGRKMTEARLPEEGQELLFACGGNMLVRRDHFLNLGGFDPSYFAYFEDVDFGWRCRLSGLRILASPNCRAAHRVSATTDKFGWFRRGFLFERNALATVMKNYDDDFRGRFLPAVLMLMQARAHRMLRTRNFGAQRLLDEPYADREQTVSLWSRLTCPGQRWSVIHDRLSVAMLQAQRSVLDRLDEFEQKRVQVQARRVLPDSEIFRQFPLRIQPIFPGDRELFDSPGFRGLLPAEPTLMPGAQ